LPSVIKRRSNNLITSLIKTNIQAKKNILTISFTNTFLKPRFFVIVSTVCLQKVNSFRSRRFPSPNRLSSLPCQVNRNISKASHQSLLLPNAFTTEMLATLKSATVLTSQQKIPCLSPSMDISANLNRQRNDTLHFIPKSKVWYCNNFSLSINFVFQVCQNHYKYFFQ